MSLKILWKSTVFVITLALIYLAFPVLIVPSSLPAIQAMFIEKEYPDDYLTNIYPANSTEADLEIYELSLPTIPTIKEKIQLIKDLHQQGMDLILNRASL